MRRTVLGSYVNTSGTFKGVVLSSIDFAILQIVNEYFYLSEYAIQTQLRGIGLNIRKKRLGKHVKSLIHKGLLYNILGTIGITEDGIEILEATRDFFQRILGIDGYGV